MSSSRHLRPASPTGRRFENPARSSSGYVYDPYDVPSNYTTREMITSPRSSGERVVPISKETYINGKLVDTTRPDRSSHHGGLHHDRHHHRRSTYDQDPRAPPSSSAHLRPAVVNDRGASADRSSTYDDRYSVVSGSSAPKKEHRRLYSVDDGKATRIPAEPELRRRDDRINRDVKDNKQHPSDRSKAYHLRGGSRNTNAEEASFEYTDARGMYRDTEPKEPRRRARRGSVDAVMRDRPQSMIEPYQTAPRLSTRELGPPPSTRGFDKVNNTSQISRHGSLQSPAYQRSPSRTRGYTTSSTFSDDENYRVPPRVSRTRDDANYNPSRRGSELLSPTRAGADDYYEPRRRSRFEDRDVASRGFGIRAPSADARSSADSGFDKYGGYTAEPLMIEAPPAPRREYPAEPREAPRDDARVREPDRREPDRIREREREVPRSPRDSPPLRERDPQRDRERIRDPEAAPRDDYSDYAPRVNGKDYDDARKLREREKDSGRDRDRPRTDFDRDNDRYSDEDRRMRDRRPERDGYGDDRRDRDRREHKADDDSSSSHSHSHAAEAIAGTAAAGAAAYGAKELHDKHSYDDRREARDDKGRDRNAQPEMRDARPTQAGLRDQYAEDGKRADRDRDRDREGGRSKRYEENGDDDDSNQPRRRHYVSKQQEQEAVERRDDDVASKHSEILDPEEDYRRRVQQVQQEMNRPQGRNDEDSDRDKRRRERDDVRSDEDSDRDRRRRERDEQREKDRAKDSRAPSEISTDYGSEPSQALTRYDTRDNEITESPVSEETSDMQEERRKKRVSIVDPPKETKAPKSILRKPTNKFPEDPNPIREGVAPLKDSKAAAENPGERWTKIPRSIVNPDALIEKGERFEEREDHVIVLRVLTRDVVQEYADRTKAIRDARYAERKERERKEKDRKDQPNSSDEREHAGRHREDERDRRDGEDRHRESGRERERERERGRDREQDEAPKDSRTPDRYKPEGY